MKTFYTCVHAGARDGYQLARALAERNRLHRLVTEFYAPCAPGWLKKACSLFPPARKAVLRTSEGLPSDRVVMDWPAFAVGAPDRKGRNPFLTPLKDRLLGKRAGRIANATGTGVLAYSYYAHHAFSHLESGRPKVIFQVHPHPDFLRPLLLEELNRVPAARFSLEREHEVSLRGAHLAMLRQEALEADFAIVASSVTRRSLVGAGFPEDKIAVVPYGVDAGPERSPVPRGAGHPLRLLCLGQIVQRKGLSYLLEAMQRLKGRPVELVLIGRGLKDQALLDAYPDVNLRVLYDAPRAEVEKELRAADVFVFPSIAEAFGLAILEAMAAGLPVITTVNTAGPDIITDGREGFIGPIRDVDFIVRKIEWFLEDPRRAVEMGRAARQTAEHFTWQRFRDGINQALDQFEASWKK